MSFSSLTVATVDRTRLRRAVWYLIPPSALATVLSLAAYMAYRFKCLLAAHFAVRVGEPVAQAGRAQSLMLAWVFFGAELLALVPDALPYILRAVAWRLPDRTQPPLEGDDVPNVDILVTCCREDIDVILDTTRAACALDYPSDRYRVFVCDDGASAEVEDAVAGLRQTYSNVYYTSRVKNPMIRDYKAGNLNSALRHSRQLPSPQASDLNLEKMHPGYESSASSIKSLDFEEDEKAHAFFTQKILQRPRLVHLSKSSSKTSLNSLFSPLDAIYPSSNTTLYVPAPRSPPSEFIAGLDADMIPSPHWLRTMLPHLLCDPDVALACPPQTFYDIPTNDPLTQTMDQFSGITELVNDAVGHADCLGSGYVARRAAVQGIGGFPVESLSEDICCSATLLGAGWKTRFVETPLQYGSVPDSYAAHVKQRTRWFVGHLQTAALFRLRLFGQRGRMLSLKQRLAGLVFDLRQLVQIPAALNYILVPFALLSGYPLVIWREDEELKWLIRSVVMYLFCRWFHQGVVGIIFFLGRGWYDVRLPSYDAELEQWMAPYMFMAWLRSFVLPTRLGGSKAGFTASGSVQSDLQERSATHRAPLLRRIRVTLFNHMVWIHVLLIASCLGGVSLVCLRALGFEWIPSLFPLRHLSSTTDQMVYLVTRLAWPPVLWFQYVCSALVPVMYMVWPPTTPERETLLERDEKTQLAYPKVEARVVKRDSGSAWRYVRCALAIGYTAALLVLSELLV